MNVQLSCSKLFYVRIERSNFALDQLVKLRWVSRAFLSLGWRLECSFNLKCSEFNSDLALLDGTRGLLLQLECDKCESLAALLSIA